MRIIYYLFIYPLSLLPMWALYFISDALYLVLYYLIPYRKKVVRSNLLKSFNTLSTREIKKLEKEFYTHFCNLLVEGIKNLSISQRDLMQRFTVTNPELLDELYAKKQSVILISGHYGNWEWLITAQDALFQHKSFGIGMPLTSNFWNDKLNEKRSRFGMTVLNAKNYKAVLKNSSQPFAVLTLGDQAPPSSEKAYWTNFLNQQSPVLLGTEFMANEFNAAVVYFSIIPVKRGYYNMTLTLITDDPRSCPFGYVTENHTRFLESQIMTLPSYWLWTHKRWKRSLPVNLEALRESQEKAFNERFRS
ncbi:MAG: lysophospholipid acyltransferase family protein [Crocinitomicaceae bacterium]